MSDETRQNRAKRDKMRQDIKLLIIATILQPDNSRIPYLCPFPAIIHYSNSVVPNLFFMVNHVKYGILIFHNYLKCLVFLVLFEEIVSF